MKLSIIAVIAFFVAALGAHAAPPSDKWLTDYDAALKAGKAQSKPVLVMFSASWCPPCNMMKKDVLPRENVQAALGKWALAYIDTDENKKLPEQYRIQAIPTFVMLDSAGAELGRFNFMPADVFAGWIEAVHNDAAALDKINGELQAKPGDAALLKQKADVLTDIGLRLPAVTSAVMVAIPGRLKEAIEAYQQAQAAGDKSPEIQGNLEFLGAVIKAVNGDFAAAGQQLDAYAKQYPNGKFAGDALFWRAVVAAQLKQQAESKAMVKQYQEKYPDGRYAMVLKK